MQVSWVWSKAREDVSQSKSEVSLGNTRNGRAAHPRMDPGFSYEKNCPVL